MANDLKHAAPAHDASGQPTDPPAPAAPAEVPAADAGAPDARETPVYADPMRAAIESEANLEPSRPVLAQGAGPGPGAAPDTPPLPEDLDDSEPLSEANQEARRNAQMRLRAGSELAARLRGPDPREQDERIFDVQRELVRSDPIGVEPVASVRDEPRTPRYDPRHPGGLLPAADPSVRGRRLNPTPQNEMAASVGPTPAFPVTRPAAD